MTVGIDHAPQISTHPTRTALGRAAATWAAERIRQAIEWTSTARVMLAAAPSQAETLIALAAEPDIDWSRVEFFHMDEYVGLAPEAPQAFGTWLHQNFLNKVPTATFHPVAPGTDPEASARHYEQLMGDAPFDVVLLGLGVNGHLAFNDPPADLDDPYAAKVVALDETSRRQQVDEGHFARLSDVPTHAVTVTIPRLLNTRDVIASVPGAPKRQAVQDTLTRPIGPDHPGTALRTHARVRLFLDMESDPR
ncbi:glucosamine-6-phosphate deaminase [Kribbella antibiotica]|uniref:Glucosamine-6-phosphate deaminase n=1 Tax=Kribbella antibiotica TaxID=190195 RepID=A0A4R4YK32_9ACTN|nr:6-phosphogluconolactonase [Kribbella antibiotica]TDD45305.1 glucosamine-6-phosphate deaminase [Kribbella antibiotica]